MKPAPPVTTTFICAPSTARSLPTRRRTPAQYVARPRRWNRRGGRRLGDFVLFTITALNDWIAGNRQPYLPLASRRRSRRARAAARRVRLQLDRAARPARRRVRARVRRRASACRTPPRCRAAPRRCTSRSCCSASAPGDDVLVPTLTFVATANAVHYVGARPVFVDSDEPTLEHRSRRCVDGGARRRGPRRTRCPRR